MINQFGLKIALPLLTACLTTLFAPSIWGKSLGLVSIGAAGSYAVCTSLSETKRKAINEKIAQQKAFVLERVVKLTEAQQELTDTKTLLSTKEAELTELLEKTKDFDQITSRLGVVELELSELSKDYEEKKDEVLTLRHDLTNFENGSYAAELREQWEVEYADKLAIFQTREAKSKYNRLQVRKLLEERDQLINELEVELEEALNNSKALVSEFTEVKKEADVTFESLGGQASSIYQQAQVELAEKVGEIKHLQDRIKELESTLSAPKRFNRVGQDAVIGNKVIDFLMSNGICMDAEDVERQFNTLNVWLSPRLAKREKLDDFLEPLQIHLGLYGAINLSIDKDCYLFKLKTENTVSDIEVEEPSLRKLESAINKNFHYRICGATGKGKSVLAANILAYKANIMGAEVDIFDPKYPDSDWGTLVPRYQGFDSCVENIGIIGETVKSRLEEALVAAQTNQTEVEHPPLVLAVDELEAIYREAQTIDDCATKAQIQEQYGVGSVARGAKRSMLDGLKVGRSRSVALLYITQSPLCSSVGFKKDDFDQSLNFFLGNTINRALEGEATFGLSDGKISLLKAEYDKRVALGQEWIMLVYDPNSGDAWLQKMPSPGHYETVKKANSDGLLQVEQSGATLDTKEEQLGAYCQCGSFSSSIKKHGRPGGKNQWHCKNPECNKKSFTALPIPKMS